MRACVQCYYGVGEERRNNLIRIGKRRHRVGRETVGRAGSELADLNVDA